MTYQDEKSFNEKKAKGPAGEWRKPRESDFISFRNDGERRGWVPMAESKPPLGICLQVIVEDLKSGESVGMRYPVYFMQGPYNHEEAFYFMGMNGMSRIDKKLCRVISWKKMYEGYRESRILGE